jgi:hypothetical protein
MEAYFLEKAPGLKEYHAVRDKAFRQIEAEAQTRHPDPTPEDVAAAEAKEAALPSRQRTATQLKRNFAPLADYLPGAARRGRRRFIQKHQRAWDKANPAPLTKDIRRALTVEFMRTYVAPERS